MLYSSTQINAERPCPISGNNNAYIVSQKDRHGKPLRNVMSVDSGLIYVDPVPFNNTEKFYQTDYRKAYKGVHSPKPKHIYRAGKVALDRFSRISPKLRPGASCLDAGSSSGEFVYLLKSKGFLAEGVEANEPYAKYSMEELNIPVTVSSFSNFQVNKKFDLITMFHVLEHLEHPLRDLSHLMSLLKPRGRMVIEVPNILFKDMGFSHKLHPGHLFSFSEKTLPSLLNKVGLVPEYCQTIEDNGNIWGEFTQCKNSIKCTKTYNLDSSQCLESLKKARLGYYFRSKNYLKIFSRIFKQISELRSAGSKRGLQILNDLYR